MSVTTTPLQSISPRSLDAGDIKAVIGINPAAVMRAWKLVKGRILAGLATGDINIFGDSYSHLADRYTNSLAKRLVSALGDGGAGWTGFSYPPAGQASVNGNARPELYPVTFSGTWGTNYNGAVYSPDCCGADSGTNGSRIICGFPANTASIVLLYGATSNGSSAGTARYSYDGGGSWTNFTLSGNNAGSIALASVPATAFTLWIEVVGTNTCRFGGYYSKSTATSGIRVNKLAGSGARLKQFADIFTGAVTRTQLQLLLSDINIIMFGANDQAHPTLYDRATFDTSLLNITSNLKLAYSKADILLVSPMENNRGVYNASTNAGGNQIVMTEYQDAMRARALAAGYAFRNLQDAFGSDPTEYASAGTFPLMNTDKLHPEPNTGGKLMTDDLYNLLMAA